MGAVSQQMRPRCECHLARSRVAEDSPLLYLDCFLANRIQLCRSLVAVLTSERVAVVQCGRKRVTIAGRCVAGQKERSVVERSIVC